MISWGDLYNILTAVVPLYVAMILAYGSVRWWKILSPDQCAGINRFVAIFIVPLFSFHFIATSDPYAMNMRFIAADTLQKIIMLVALGFWAAFTKSGSLEWMITIFSLSTLPNTLVMGIPLLTAMYGGESGGLMVQVVVLQCAVWNTLLMLLFECRGAKMLIMERFPETAASIASFKVGSDVVSLDGRDCLETDAEVGVDGKLRVSVRKSSASRRSNLAGAEIYSLNSGVSRLSTDCYSIRSSRGPTPRPSDFRENSFRRFGLYRSQSVQSSRPSNFAEHSSTRFGFYRAPNPGFSSMPTKTVKYHPPPEHCNNDAKELHMFVWSSISNVFDGNDFTTSRQSSNFDQGAREVKIFVADHLENSESKEGEFLEENCKRDGEDNEKENKEGPIGPSKIGSSTSVGHLKQMPPAGVMIRLLLIMVWRKLIRNPNTYSCLIGVIWSLVSFRWRVEMPKIISQSISILSDAGLGMCMFSLGLFMTLQPKIIPCGNSVAAFAMAVRFLTGPAVMAGASLAMGIRGTLLRIAIVQAALPQGIVAFVYAKEYNVHPTILSTAVIFGMLIALPITLVYYILLGL